MNDVNRVPWWQIMGAYLNGGWRFLSTGEKTQPDDLTNLGIQDTFSFRNLKSEEVGLTITPDQSRSFIRKVT